MKKVIVLIAVLLTPSLVFGQSFVGTEMTPIPMVIVAATAVPTAFSTPQYIVTPTNSVARSITVDNSTGSAEVYCAYNGSATPHFKVPAGAAYTDNFGDRAQVMPRALGCINPAQNTPSTGSVAIYGDR